MKITKALLEQTIKVIENEKLCVLRNRNGCNRDCANCDLVLSDWDIISAYNFVLATLYSMKVKAEE